MESTKRGAFAGGSRLLERGTRDQARLTWRLLRDKRVTALKYAIPVLLLAYLLSPVDAIPDLLLGIGQADDLGFAVAALMLMIRVVPKLAPGHVVDDHLRDMGQDGQSWEPSAGGAERVVDARFTVRT